ncbi:MAG: energy-coupling factor transporter ATPase, partial [Bifidobacterium sp.]|nr:energy-coupling factor transporter ATPase [Bifidobacterium sp.]
MSAARDTVIALAGVRYSYDAGATWTLDGVDLTVRAGERVALAGANGSGKSTLARVMAGLAAPDHGTVELMGRRVFDDAVGARPDAYRAATRAIGMVFQNPEDQIVTTVTADDVAFGPENLDVAPALIGGRVRDALDAVDMDGWQEADPTRLSGGQQQRIAIAGMLAMDSRVLILDEPTAMLDPAARADVLRTLDTIQARGTAIVLITHHPDERLRADRVVTLAHGRVVSDVPGGGTGRAAMPTETHAGTTAPIDRTASGAVTVDGSADGAPIIAFDHVTFAYPGETAPVLDDFTCAIGRGRIVAVTGPNGWGKTTFARLLTGLERAQAGTVTVDGIDVGHARRARRRALRRTVGFVMQRPERQLFADTVAQDVAFGPANQKLPREEVGARVRDALAFVGLEDMAQRSPFELSGGQQRLAAIAGVLACEPRVLVMDEPTA